MDELVGDEEQKDFIIYKQNKPIWKAFLLVQTQWRKDFGSYLGLDYTAVFNAWNMHGIKRKQQKALFKKLRIIEFSALKILNKNE